MNKKFILEKIEAHYNNVLNKDDETIGIVVEVDEGCSEEVWMGQINGQRGTLFESFLEATEYVSEYSLPVELRYDDEEWLVEG